MLFCWPGWLDWLKTVSKIETKVYFFDQYIVLVCIYLAMGGTITTIAYNFRMGVSTAWEIILDVCTAIWEVLFPIHIPVPSEDECKRIAAEFEEWWNCLNCIGAIDGKHVMIWWVFNSGSLFYNYKSFFSIVLLGITSADYRFVMVDIVAYGSSNDSGDLNSTIYFKRLKKQNSRYSTFKEVTKWYGKCASTICICGRQSIPIEMWFTNTILKECANKWF